MLPKRFSFRLAGPLKLLRQALIALIVLSFLASTVMIAQIIPAAAARNQQEYRLAADLLSKHITHIYSEYWTCGRIMFQSQEKIICAVVDEHMQVSHNRYEPYARTVVADPHAAYIFPEDPVYAAYVSNFLRLMQTTNTQYQYYHFDGYVVFAPIGPSVKEEGGLIR